MVAGDVNGDGYPNDRAFVYSPSNAADPILAEGMRQLLASSTGATRECLEKQIGVIAARNSCRGPWSSTAQLNITIDRAKFRVPNRAAISFSLSNPLGAADLALNGSQHLKGWGQNALPDQSLLYVRGFDAQSKRYSYEVNQRFGATRPQLLTLRSPVILTTSMRWDLGPMRERQSLTDQLRFGRSVSGARYSEAMFRSMGTNSVFSPMGSILRQQDSLRLTAEQADSIAAMNRRYTYRSDSLWAPVARYLAKLPKEYDAGEAWDRFLDARRAQIDLLMQMGPAIRELLTAEQRRKLPQYITNMLDTRYLISIRNGTGTYAGGGGFGGFGGFSPMFFEGHFFEFAR
jgi:hypothetical protein